MGFEGRHHQGKHIIDGKERRELGRDEEWIHDSYGNLQNGFDFRKSTEIPKPPGEGLLHIARQRRTKQKQMKIILREIFLYFAFILVLSVVAYGSRDTQAYAVTKALTDIFPESKYTSLLPFDQVNMRNCDETITLRWQAILPLLFARGIKIIDSTALIPLWFFAHFCWFVSSTDLSMAICFTF